MARDGPQHVGKAAKHVRPDGLALERSRRSPHHTALCCRYAEVVGPELHEPFDEAAISRGCGLEARMGVGPEQLLRDGWLRAHRLGCRWLLHVVSSGHFGGGLDLAGSFRRLGRRLCFLAGLVRLRRLLFVTLQPDALLLGKQGLQRGLGRGEVGSRQQPGAGQLQLRFQEGARVGGCACQIIRGATRAVAEPAERDKTRGTLGVDRH
jgi:hypothetical protein